MDLHNTDDSVTRRIRAMTDRIAMLKANDLYFYNQPVQEILPGMKVRVKLRFRGRQKAHKEFGFEVVNRLIRETAAFGKPDTLPKLQDNRDLQVLITPLPKEQRGKRPAAAAVPAVPGSGPAAPKPERTSAAPRSEAKPSAAVVAEPEAGPGVGPDEHPPSNLPN